MNVLYIIIIYYDLTIELLMKCIYKLQKYTSKLLITTSNSEPYIYNMYICYNDYYLYSICDRIPMNHILVYK